MTGKGSLNHNSSKFHAKNTEDVYKRQSTISWLQDVSENVTFTVKSIPIEQTSSRSKP